MMCYVTVTVTVMMRGRLTEVPFGQAVTHAVVSLQQPIYQSDDGLCVTAETWSKHSTAWRSTARLALQRQWSPPKQGIP